MADDRLKAGNILFLGTRSLRAADRHEQYRREGERRLAQRLLALAQPALANANYYGTGDAFGAMLQEIRKVLSP
jgi:hypothetical protein